MLESLIVATTGPGPNGIEELAPVLPARAKVAEIGPTERSLALVLPPEASGAALPDKSDEPPTGPATDIALAAETREVKPEPELDEGGMDKPFDEKFAHVIIVLFAKCTTMLRLPTKPGESTMVETYGST